MSRRVRSKRSRSACGWLGVGTAASSDAARMRTPRTGSDSSGAASGKSCAAGMASSMSRAPIRTIGSGSESAVRAKLIFEGATRDESSLSALARANAGALPSDATAASSAAASAFSVQAEWKASAYAWKPFRPDPCQSSIADAAHAAALSR